ncbi:MAG TPA: hypothetical protein VHS78_10500 [Candidatus Elarobacter sp.]|nr:hypothetical protein [Candidatus Elarobacter sp.]
MNAKEYQYDVVGVTYKTHTQIFTSPQKVTSDPSGVTVVDLAGRTWSFPSGSVVGHGTGTYYVFPGAKEPTWLARAKYVKTLTPADI